MGHNVQVWSGEPLHQASKNTHSRCIDSCTLERIQALQVFFKKIIQQGWSLAPFLFAFANQSFRNEMKHNFHLGRRKSYKIDDLVILDYFLFCKYESVHRWLAPLLPKTPNCISKIWGKQRSKIQPNQVVHLTILDEQTSRLNSTHRLWFIAKRQNI